MPYAPPPDPGGYAPQQQYAQPYAPYGQPGMAPAPYYAAPQYAAQGPPGYAQVSLPAILWLQTTSIARPAASTLSHRL